MIRKLCYNNDKRIVFLLPVKAACAAIPAIDNIASLPFFNSLVCNSSNLASSFGLMLAGSHPKSPARVVLSIEAVRTSTAAIEIRIYYKKMLYVSLFMLLIIIILNQLLGLKHQDFRNRLSLRLRTCLFQ